MKTIKCFLIVFFTGAFFTSCESIPFLNLERDNPLDNHNSILTQDGIYLKFFDYNVYLDDNGDRYINKGETVELNVALTNIGTKGAQNVRVKFSTSSPYVLDFSPTTQVNYGEISPSQVVWYDFYQYTSSVIRFKVLNTTPANTKIPIDITMTDDKGNTWTDQFEVMVVETDANIVFDNYYVYSDDNQNRIVNKGETVKLNVSLKNMGGSGTSKVQALFSCSSPYVSGFAPTTPVLYGDIAKGQTVWYGVYQYTSSVIRFKVLNTTPANTKIPIDITMTDDKGNTWTDQFEVMVVETDANIVFDNYYVYSDDNQNRIVNKGETVKLNVSLKNMGGSGTSKVQALFSCSSPYVSGFAPTTPVLYGDIAKGQTVWYGVYQYSNSVIQFKVSNSTPTNTKIPIVINIVDEFDNHWTSTFEVNVQ